MKKLVFLSLILFSVSCSTKIKYLGDSYAPSNEVEVYYDEGDVKREYRVMGLMTADSFRSLQDMRDKMIESAKSNGADGIIFRGFYEQPTQIDANQNVVEGQLIKFTN